MQDGKNAHFPATHGGKFADAKNAGMNSYSGIRRAACWTGKNEGETMNGLSKEEKSLLLYLESQAVDTGGLLQQARMNANDFEILERWKEVGFIQFGRIALDDIPLVNYGGTPVRTHWCLLSESAWQAAQAERRARHQRLEARIAVQRSGLGEVDA